MAQDTELSGHVLAGKYRLIRRVAEGPREVHEARHDSLAGRVAVKLWPATTPWDAFRRGAERASTLRHPGVMQVLDFNCEPGRSPFLVLEWVDGRRLSEIIAEAGLLPLERVAPLIESAAWALAAAHQQGLVHQELRPDEIFVVQAAGTTREWVKLAGFGVAAALAHAGVARPSRVRAPEQRRASDATGETTGVDGDDPLTDQYALAAIAYEMLAGVPPFDDEHTQTEPPPISDLAPGVSPAVDAAIRQALSTEPEQRFADVLDFARALRAAAEGASAEAVRKGRRGGKKTPRADGGRAAISPFFNPLQGAGEALRRVVRETARLRPLEGSRSRTLMRVGLAGTGLVLAFAAVAAFVHHDRRATPPGIVTTTLPATAPSAVPPATVVAAAGAGATEPTAPEPPAAPPEPEATPPVTDRAAAWTRLAPKRGPRRAAVALAPKAAAPKAAAPKPTPPAPAAPPSPATCVMSVGSRPPADIWIDDHSLGRRTPLANHRLPCGDHKLVLKRTDLDIYQMEIVTLRPGAAFRKVYPLQ